MIHPYKTLYGRDLNHVYRVSSIKETDFPILSSIKPRSCRSPTSWSNIFNFGSHFPKFSVFEHCWGQILLHLFTFHFLLFSKLLSFFKHFSIHFHLFFHPYFFISLFPFSLPSSIPVLLIHPLISLFFLRFLYSFPRLLCQAFSILFPDHYFPYPILRFFHIVLLFHPPPLQY